MHKHITLIPTNPPICVLYDTDAVAQPQIAPRPVLTNPELARGDRFVCAACGAAITSASLRIAINGSHRHTVPRSFGLDQEIGCFSLAPGCAVLGHFALDFANASKGHWNMGVCATCGEHLGWHHVTEDGFGFFGLLLDHLELGPDEETSATRN